MLVVCIAVLFDPLSVGDCGTTKLHCAVAVFKVAFKYSDSSLPVMEEANWSDCTTRTGSQKNLVSRIRFAGGLADGAER
jgi:hypothetical protein